MMNLASIEHRGFSAALARPPSRCLPPVARSWVLPADRPVGPIPCWRSRDAWLLAVSLASHSPRAAKIMARRVSRRALMAVARADAAAADHATGRWVATANATVARRIGLCERTVQYARATLVHLGLCRIVATGRYLTTTERRTAASTHGGRQVRAASTRVLTMSCAIVCALPRRGHHYKKVQFLDGHQRTRTRVRRPATPEKKPLWLQKLAAHLDQHLPWLVRNHHIGRLCHALTALGINEHWQPADLDALLDAMNRRNRRLGLDMPCATNQHSPLGLFIHQARDTLTHDNPHERRLTREHHRAQLIDDQLHRRAEAATLKARLAAEHADLGYQARRRERREILRAALRTGHHRA